LPGVLIPSPHRLEERRHVVEPGRGIGPIAGEALRFPLGKLGLVLGRCLRLAEPAASGGEPVEGVGRCRIDRDGPLEISLRADMIAEEYRWTLAELAQRGVKPL
jgi:hypothetical protein